MPRTPRAWPAAAAVAATALYLAFVLAAPAGAATTLAINVLQVVAPGLAAVAAGLASRSSPVRQHRVGWRLVALACLSWALGQSVWTVLEARGDEVPFPSAADAGFLPAVPLLAFGLVLLGPRTGQATRARILLDGLLTAAALLLIMWVVVLGEMYRQDTEGAFALGIALAYPVGDVVMGAVVLNVATRAPASDRHVWTAVGLGVAGWSLADSGFAYLATTGAYGTGDWIDVGWFGGFLAVAVAGQRAAVQPLRDEVSDVLRLTNLGVPWILVGVAVAVAVREQAVRGVLQPALVWIGVVMVSTIVLRQFVSQVEIRRLNERLKQANLDLGAMLVERERGEEARAQLEAARRQAAFRTEFLNSAAHELATPMTPVQLQLELLSSSLAEKGDPEMDRHIAILRRNVDRLTGLVHDLLLAARMDLDRLALRVEEADLGQLVAHAVEDAAGHAAARGVEVRAEPPAEPVWAEVDRRRMGQVVTNLVSNAVKFTPAGGRVTAAVRREGDRVLLRVQDTGIGLSPEQAARLFQPFVEIQAHAATVQSTGLGLYITKGLVQRHHGSLRVESPGPGRGSTFTVDLPARQPPPPAPPASGRPVSGPSP